MIAVDANVLVYSIDSGNPLHEASRNLLEGWRARGTPWCTTWTVLYQFLRVTTHPRAPHRPLPRAAAAAWIRQLLEVPGFTVLGETPAHGETLARTLEEFPALQGNILHDVHIAVVLREHGIRALITRDADFHRFPFLDAIDPLDSRAAGGEGLVRESPRPRPVRPRGSRTPSSRR